MLVCGTKYKITGEKKWFRFSKFDKTNYYFLEEEYWDAIAFVPKREIKFLGFGLMRNFECKDMWIKVRWQIGSYSSEVHMKYLFDG